MSAAGAGKAGGARAASARTTRGKERRSQPPILADSDVTAVRTQRRRQALGRAAVIVSLAAIAIAFMPGRSPRPSPAASVRAAATGSRPSSAAPATSRRHTALSTSAASSCSGLEQSACVARSPAASVRAAATGSRPSSAAPAPGSAKARSARSFSSLLHWGPIAWSFPAIAAAGDDDDATAGAGGSSAQSAGGDAGDGETRGDAGDANAIVKTAERGPVRVTLRLEPAEPVIGDRLTLRLEATADPGVELLMPEFGESLDRFAIVDFVPGEKVDSDGRTVDTQTYTLEAPNSGEQSVPPIMVEFVDRRPGNRPAPEGEDAYEVLTDRLPFTVASVTPSDATADMKPPLGKLAALAKPGPRPALWLALALIVLAAVVFGLRRWIVSQGRARRRSAYEVAHSRLAALMARPRPDAAAVDAFFVELSAIVRRYLEDRFELRSPELTTEEFLEVASGSPDLTDEHRGFLREFLRSADMVKFARYVPAAEDIERALAAAARFLDQTKEAAHA